MSGSVILLSGGMDSTVLLAFTMRTFEGDPLLAVSFDYGQRHRRELQHASMVCARLRVRHLICDLSGIGALLGGSALTDLSIQVPEGHYEDQSMRSTVVSNRNMILLSAAGGIAMSRKMARLGIAAHSGDHAIYPDCRPAFLDGMANVFQLCDYHPVDLWRPFASMSKAQIAKLGSELNAPVQLSWSCYKGGARHCGKCGTCVERREAFAVAGTNDPTDYDD